MSSTNVSVGDRLMDKLAGELGLSECGKAWVTAAIDPYHDVPLENYSGYPDNNENPSVQQIVKSSFQLNSASVTSGNYDCHIVFWPWLGNNNGYINGSQFDLFGGYAGGQAIPSTNPAGYGYAGITTDTVSSGSLTYQFNSVTVQQQDAAVNAIYCVNDWRLVAVGMEVVNTTSDLNVQGLVTCYRAPISQRASKSTVSYYNLTSGSTPTIDAGWIDTIVVSNPPPNIATALLLPGTVQWKAKEGAYVVPTLNSTNLVSGPDQTAAITIDSTGNAVVRGVTYNGAFNPGNSTIRFWYPVGINIVDFNMAGIYFTGLSQSTTLTVNVIKYFERFPSADIPSDVPLVVLSRPSCRFDPKAIELYSAVIRHMPVGVPQKYNGIGDWFKEAAQTARDIVSPVLSAIPHPIAMMGAGILNGIAGNITKKYSVDDEKSMPAAGQIYRPAGDQSQMKAKPKKSKPASVAVQLANLGLKKKKKKKGAVEVVKMVKKK